MCEPRLSVHNMHVYMYMYMYNVCENFMHTKMYAQHTYVCEPRLGAYNMHVHVHVQCTCELHAY